MTDNTKVRILFKRTFLTFDLKSGLPIVSEVPHRSAAGCKKARETQWHPYASDGVQREGLVHSGNLVPLFMFLFIQKVHFFGLALRCSLNNSLTNRIWAQMPLAWDATASSLQGVRSVGLV